MHFYLEIKYYQDLIRDGKGGSCDNWRVKYWHKVWELYAGRLQGSKFALYWAHRVLPNAQRKYKQRSISEKTVLYLTTIGLILILTNVNELINYFLLSQHESFVSLAFFSLGMKWLGLDFFWSFEISTSTLVTTNIWWVDKEVLRLWGIDLRLISVWNSSRVHAILSWIQVLYGKVWVIFMLFDSNIWWVDKKVLRLWGIDLRLISVWNSSRVHAVLLWVQVLYGKVNDFSL